MFDPEEFFESPRSPGPDDAFFPPAHETSGAATVGDPFFAWQRYAQGFKDAGDFLVEHGIHRGSMQDWLVFPILAMYRQSIELALKCLIHDCLSVAGPRRAWEERYAEGKPSPLTKHDLPRLWDEALRLMTALNPPILADEAIQHTGRLIQELSELDPDSSAFRYPTTKKGEPTLPERQIDLPHSKEIVEMIHGVLNGIGECALQEASHESEMRHEYAKP